MKISKEQIYNAIITQAKNIERQTKCTGKEAIARATIQVNQLLKGLTHGNLNLQKILKTRKEERN